MDEVTKQERVEQLVDYIMKHCLWQFHSRAWDRERQNREILTKAAQELCGECPPPTDRLDRCHWVDAVLLARAYRSRYPWIRELDRAEKLEVMQGLRERMDYLTITGSLNLELKDHQY